MPTLTSLPPDSFGLVCEQLQAEIEWHGCFGNFWKELSNIEEENAKKIIKLCKSSDANLKQSGLQKVMSKAGKSCYDSSIQSAWFHTKDQVEKLANRRLELADTLRCSVSTPLTLLAKETEKKLIAIAVEGKHQIATTRQAFINLHKAQGEYYELRRQSIRHSNEFHEQVARHMNENEFKPPTPAAKQTANQKSNEVRARRLDQHRQMAKSSARAAMQRYHQSVELAKSLRQNLLSKNLPESYQKLEELHMQISKGFTDGWQTLAGLIAVLPRYCEDIHNDILAKRNDVHESIEADVIAFTEAAQKGARKEQSVPEAPIYQPFDGKESFFYRNAQEQSEENVHEQNMFAERLSLSMPGLRSMTPPSTIPLAAATAPAAAGGAASPVVWAAEDRPTPSAPPLYPARVEAPPPSQAPPSTVATAQPNYAAPAAASAQPSQNLMGPPSPFVWEEPVKPQQHKPSPSPPPPQPQPQPPQQPSAPQFPPTVVAGSSARSASADTAPATVPTTSVAPAAPIAPWAPVVAPHATSAAEAAHPPVVAIPITWASPIPEIPDVVKPTAPSPTPTPTPQMDASPTSASVSEATQPSSLNVSQEGGEAVVPTPAAPTPLEAHTRENGAAHDVEQRTGDSPTGSPSGPSPRGEDIVAPTTPLTQTQNTSPLSEDEWRDVQQNAESGANAMKLLDMLNALQVMAKGEDYYGLYGFGQDGSVFVHRSVTLQQVTRQRRQLTASLHPDRMGEEGKEEAEAQLAKINQIFTHIFKNSAAWSEYNRLCDLRAEYAHWMHEDASVLHARVRDLKSLRRNVKKNGMPIGLTAEVQNAYKFLATILTTAEQ